MGVLSSHGIGIPAFANTLYHGTNQFKQSMRFPQLTFPIIAAELNAFHFESAIQQFIFLPDTLKQQSYHIGRRAPLTIQTSIIAALEAWEQARLFERDIDPTRVGIIVAGENTTQAYQYNLQQQFQEEASYLSPKYALHFMDTDQVGTLSEIFGIHGEGFTVGGASASGNVGMIQATRLIQQGIIDICLVVGALADFSPVEIQGFRNIGALGGIQFADQPNKACRPFDKEHEGFIWGQASASLILETEKTAEKRQIIGKIAGTAISLDGNRLANPTTQGEVRVMQHALADAKLLPEQIQYINTHGSSSPLGDNTEIAAIKTVLGNAISHVWINSTKSIVGHCIWSAGILEAIATFLQIQAGTVHPNLNLDNPIDHHCRFVSNKSEKVQIDAALSNSFGFGGINTSIILTRGD